MTTRTQNRFAHTYTLLRKALPDEPGWLSELRDEAFENFKALGLPTVKHEEWRWTNLKRIADTDFVPAELAEVSEAQLAKYLIEDADEIRLVFVNGHFADKLSKLPTIPDGLVIEPISRVLGSDEGLQVKLGRFAEPTQPFTALNTALFTDGAYIRAGNSLTIQTPIHVLYVSTDSDAPAVSSPRTLVLAGESSELRVIESFVGHGNSPRLVNSVTEIVAKGNAAVRHVKLLRESDGTSHLGWTELNVERDANVSSHSINLDAGLARNDVHAVLAAEGANCSLNGLVLGRDRQHFDNHIVVDHVRPHGTSSQLYRAVVDDKSRSVFAGKVIVRQGAHGTDAQQQNNNLLLSNDAKVDTKPQLEIYTDDVKCSHGATSGQLNPEAIFFLRCRGLDETHARNLLTYAFANNVIEHIKIDPVRLALEKLLTERFAGLLGGSP
ncbi:MAG: Fe-S cluster assembly protein SufD [Planctomycetes bacterium]|nr:Fe-S cluster assembly protein SufD [Planctomycetota bacterium]